MSSKPAHLITLRSIFHFPNYTNIRFYMHFHISLHMSFQRDVQVTPLRMSLAKWLTSLPVAFTHIKLVNGTVRLHTNKIIKLSNWRILVRTQWWFCTRIFRLKIHFSFRFSHIHPQSSTFSFIQWQNLLKIILTGVLALKCSSNNF